MLSSLQDFTASRFVVWASRGGEPAGSPDVSGAEFATDYWMNAVDTSTAHKSMMVLLTRPNVYCWR
jgi:hypothetical protein